MSDDEHPTFFALDPDGDPATYVDAVRAAAGLPPLAAEPVEPVHGEGSSDSGH